MKLKIGDRIRWKKKSFTAHIKRCLGIYKLKTDNVSYIVTKLFKKDLGKDYFIPDGIIDGKMVFYLDEMIKVK